MSKIIIRSVELNDIQSIERLLCQLSNPIGKEAIFNNIKQYINNVYYDIMVAELNSIVIGLVAVNSAIFLHRKNNIARIMAVVVDTNYRKCGVGKLLIKNAEEWAIKKGCDIIELTSGIARKSIGTHNFYEKLGYKNSENQKIYLRKNIF